MDYTIDKLLENNFENKICFTAALHDVLWLNGLQINSNILFLLQLKSFIHVFDFNYNSHNFTGISFGLKNSDIKMLDSLGIDFEYVENSEFDKYIKSGIPLVGRTCLSVLNKRNHKVDFEPLHTEIFMKLENEMYFTSAIGTTKEKFYTNRPKCLVDKARHSLVIPFSPKGLAYRISTSMSQNELDIAVKKQIRKVMLEIINSYTVIASPLMEKNDNNENMYFYSGIACHDVIITFINRIADLYCEKQITKTNFVVNMHILLKCIMPNLSNGDFARTEICNSLSYLSAFFNDSSFSDSAIIFEKSKVYWLKLAKILYNPKKFLEDEQLVDFRVMMSDIFKNIFEIEQKAISVINLQCLIKDEQESPCYD